VERTKSQNRQSKRQSPVDTVKTNLRRIERREWQLWIVAILVSLVLLCGLMAFILPGLGLGQSKFSLRLLPPVVQGLVALVLIFDIYTIFQQLQIHRMRNRMAEREELFRLISENAADMIAVVDMDGAEADAKGLARGGVGGVEGEEKSDGVCSAGDGCAEAVAGLDVGAVEGERWWHCFHVNWFEFYTGTMFETRLATVADAALIAEQRCRMFVDAGQTEDVTLDAVKANFETWVRPRLQDGSYVGWLVQEGERVVAGAGMWLMDFPPHWMDAMPLRAYLLNFYVEVEFRGYGLAYALLKTTVEEARRRGIKVVSLHASKFGKPLYERNGFELSSEMMLRLDA